MVYTVSAAAVPATNVVVETFDNDICGGTRQGTGRGGASGVSPSAVAITAFATVMEIASGSLLGAKW